MSDDIAIRVDNVSKDFILPHERKNTIKSIVTSGFRTKKGSSEHQHALKDINLEIKKGEFFGIVGKNGSGKSTLLKILAGIYQPTSGKIQVYGKLVPFIELGVGFNPELTGRENVYLNGAMLGFSTSEIDAMYEDIVKFAELGRFMDQKLKNYSSGMQVRLAFSMAIRAEADILLIDEVLAVGDAAFQRKCYSYFKKLRKDKKTVVFVSHDMGAIREFCTSAALVNENEIKSIGHPNKIAEKYSKLFIEESIEEESEQEYESTFTEQEKRWGNGKISFLDCNVNVHQEEIIVRATAQVSASLDHVIYGLHVFSEDGQEITAMNNRMINNPDLKNLQKGQNVNFEWKVQNIFNDGGYYITLTLVDEAGTSFDWYNEASTFVVRRTERSTTPVLPPVNVTYKIL